MPQRVLLTFLGTGGYMPADYEINGEIHRQITYFSVALARQLQPDLVISLETKDASIKHGPSLADALRKSGILNHKVAAIPDGKTEAELWEIFSRLTDCVPTDCELHLDITHGFRSLPVVGLIALNYLRVTRNSAIGGVYYGAYEAKNAEGTTPAFDITPFLSLLDWTSAAEQFFETGSAAKFDRLLSETQRGLHRETNQPADRALPTSLASIGSTLQKASDNLLLLRVGSLAESSASVVRQLQRKDAPVEINGYARPFLEVAEYVGNELARFQDTDLNTLRELVGWLAERGHTATAITLAREWLISWLCLYMGHHGHVTDPALRKPADDLFGVLAGEPQKMVTCGGSIRASLKQVQRKLAQTSGDADTVIKNFRKAASSIGESRNDLNHAGFRKSPTPAATLRSSALQLQKNLNELPLI